MLKLVPLAALVALTGLPLAAHADPSQACMRVSDIQSSRMQPDDRAVYFRLSSGATYRLDFASACPNASSETLILHSADNSGEACGAIGLDVRVRGGGGCLPSNLTRLSPEEVAALPPAQRP